MKYIAFLRGINVGGHQVKMESLRQLFTEAGLTDVRSYIASGNLFFATDRTDREALKAELESKLLKTLEFEVPIFLRTAEEVEEILLNNPFNYLEVTPEMRFCILFIEKQLSAEIVLPHFSPKKDIEIIEKTPKEAFIIWHIRDGRPPTTAFIDSHFGKRTTTRFLHTLAKIVAAAKEDQ